MSPKRYERLCRFTMASSHDVHRPPPLSSFPSSQSYSTGGMPSLALPQRASEHSSDLSAMPPALTHSSPWTTEYRPMMPTPSVYPTPFTSTPPPADVSLLRDLHLQQHQMMTAIQQQMHEIRLVSQHQAATTPRPRRIPSMNRAMLASPSDVATKRTV